MILTVPQVLTLYPPGYGGDVNRMIDIDMGMGSLGDDSTDDSGNDSGDDTGVDLSTLPLDTTSSGGTSSLTITPTVTSSSGVAPTISGGFSAAQIAQMIAAGGSAAAQALSAVSCPAGYIYNTSLMRCLPSTAGIVPTTTVSASVAGSMVPLLMIGLGIVAVMMIAKK